MLVLILLSTFAFYSCNAACGDNSAFDLKSIDGVEDLYVWDQVTRTNTVDFAICKTNSKSGCGVGTICPNPNCCGSCQRWVDDSGPMGACLGVYKETVITKNANGEPSLALHYVAGDPIPTPPGVRELYINLTCVPGKNKPNPIAFLQPTTDGHTPNTPYNYFLTMETSAVCGAPSGGGVYGGGVFLILLFVGFFVYFAAGVAYNFSQHKEGRELVPHIEFWSDSPTLFIEGCQILWRKVTGIFGRNEYETVS